MLGKYWELEPVSRGSSPQLEAALRRLSGIFNGEPHSGQEARGDGLNGPFQLLSLQLLGATI